MPVGPVVVVPERNEEREAVVAVEVCRRVEPQAAGAADGRPVCGGAGGRCRAVPTVGAEASTATPGTPSRAIAAASAASLIAASAPGAAHRDRGLPTQHQARRQRERPRPAARSRARPASCTPTCRASPCRPVVGTAPPARACAPARPPPPPPTVAADDDVVRADESRIAGLERVREPTAGTSPQEVRDRRWGRPTTGRIGRGQRTRRRTSKGRRPWARRDRGGVVTTTSERASVSRGPGRPGVRGPRP